MIDWVGVHVQHLMWLPRIVLACVSPPTAVNTASSADLLLYPRYHLDNASLLGRFPLQQARPSLLPGCSVLTFIQAFRTPAQLAKRMLITKHCLVC